MNEDILLFVNDISSKLNNLYYTKKEFSIIHSFPLNSKQCIYVVDWELSVISYQRDIKKVLGYNDDEFNLETILTIAHPDDLHLIKKITQATVNHLTNHGSFSQDNVTLNITYRFRRKDGSYIKLLRQSTVYETTTDGKMRSNFSLLTDISFFDKTEHVEWHFEAPLTEQENFKKEIYKEFQSFFTHREVEIIKLIANNYKTKAMADKLFISEHTVYSHRKNILRKCNCHDSQGLIDFCMKIGIL